MAALNLKSIKSATIAGLTLVAAWHAYKFAVVPTLRLSSPEMALALRPFDAVSISRQLNARMKEEGAYITDPEDASQAARSLIETPLSRSSLRIIGMNAASSGKTDTAMAAMSLSHRVSRRDPWTEVWLLEQAARNNDYEGILNHYHAALTVNPELAKALNPVFVDATQYAQVRLSLKEYLRQNASWAPGYLAEASKDARLDDLIDLVLPVAQHLASDTYTNSISTIVYRLAVSGRWDEAMRLADATWSDFDTSQFEKFSPDSASSDPRLGKLAWSLRAEQGINSSLDKDGGIDASLAPLARGTIASRDVWIAAPGSYTLTHRIDLAGSWQRARLRWVADCVFESEPTEERVWGQTIPSASKTMTFRSSIAIPNGCHLLRLTLVGTGPDGQSEASLTLRGLEFTKTGH